MEKSEFDASLYFKDSKPLTDEEFKKMMNHSNKEISIDKLKKINFDCSKYIKIN